MGYRSFAIAFGAATVLASGSAVAAPTMSSGRYQSIVAVGGIDAATPEGAEALARKVRAAANRACRDAAHGSALPISIKRDCVRRSVADAQPQVDRVVAIAQHARPAGTEVAFAPRR